MKSTQKGGLTDEQKSDLLKRLQSFNPDFTELREYVEEPNLFRILRSSGTEIRHSNFLAWLMDVNANHKMKNAFLLPFLQKLKDDYHISQLNTNLSDLKFTISREHYFIYDGEKRYLDLLLVDKDFDSGSGLIICIENKITSKENGGQLAAYKQYINESEFKNCKNKIFLYLTPTKEIVGDKDWVKISYDVVLYALELSLKTPGLSMIVKRYLTEYKSVLRRDIMNIDEELQLCCKEIYDSNKDIFDLIFQNVVAKSYDKLSNAISETLIELEKQKLLELVSSTNTEFRFTTEKLKSIVPNATDGELNYLKTTHRIVYWLWLTNDTGKGTARLRFTAALVGNRDNEYSKNVICVANKKYKEFSIKQITKIGRDYTTVFAKSIEGKMNDDFIEMVKERIKTFVEEDTEQFERNF